MSPLGQFPKVAFPLLALALTFFAACDSGGGMGGDDNQAPNAKLTVSSTEVMVDDTIELNASGSSDPDGDNLDFSWSVQAPDGSDVSLSGKTSEKVDLVADVTGDYTPKVEVSDGKLSDSDEVTITATEDTPGAKDSVTVSAEAVTDDGARIDSAAILFDGTQVGNGYAEKTYVKDSDREITIRSEEDDYESAEATVSLGGDHDLSLEMLEKLPKTVTVPFENVATDGDSLVAHTISWNDSVVVENATKSGTAEIPGSREEGKLCAQESDLFNEGCITLVPTGDVAETQTIQVDRKTVELTVSGDLPYGNVSEAEFSIITGKDTTNQFTGEKTLQLPKLAESKTRKVAGNLITDDPERDGRLDRLYGETSVSANTDVEATVGFEALPACDDGISNETGDFEDGLVDVWEDTNGNGIPDSEDKGDPGCTGLEDDNEGHIIFTSTTGSGGEGNDLTKLVSSKDGDREVLKGDNAFFDYPSSIQKSIGGIFVANDTKRSPSQSGEEFAARFECGQSDDSQNNVNLTDIVADQNEQDGWSLTRTPGVDTGFFETGTDCSVYFVHGTKVRDKPPGDGNDDVIFLEAGDDTIRSFVVRWVIEEEDDHRKSALKSTRQEGSRKCWQTSFGKICRGVRSTYPN